MSLCVHGTPSCELSRYTLSHPLPSPTRSPVLTEEPLPQNFLLVISLRSVILVSVETPHKLFSYHIRFLISQPKPYHLLSSVYYLLKNSTGLKNLPRLIPSQYQCYLKIDLRTPSTPPPQTFPILSSLMRRGTLSTPGLKPSLNHPRSRPIQSIVRTFTTTLLLNPLQY